MKKYNQLTLNQRYQIEVLLKAKHSVYEIANAIEVSHTTIYREIRRNGGDRKYLANRAHNRAIDRRKVRTRSLKRIPIRLIKLVEEKLQEQWSPEQISGWLKLHLFGHVSHEWIYRYVQLNKANGGPLYLHLRHGRKRKKQYGKRECRGVIKDRISISERPPEVDQKTRFGDLEVDTIAGKANHQAIVSIVERTTMATFLIKVPRKTSKLVKQAIISSIAPVKRWIHTITSDNGKEFADHKDISNKLEVDFFFADPYSSWQRGLNENTNGLVRQYFKKGLEFSRISQWDVFRVMYKLNNRPRKNLGFKTPREVFMEKTGCDVNQLGFVALGC